MLISTQNVLTQNATNIYRDCGCYIQYSILRYIQIIMAFLQNQDSMMVCEYQECLYLFSVYYMYNF